MAATLVESIRRTLSQQNSKTTIRSSCASLLTRSKPARRWIWKTFPDEEEDEETGGGCGPDGSTATVGEYVTQNQKIRFQEIQKESQLTGNNQHPTAY